MESIIKLDTQIVGNIGMFYTCYELSRRGWNVMPTSRNARGIDIIAYNSQATNYIGIQVKTLSKRNAVPLGSGLDKIMGDYWVIVDKVATEPRVFILLPEEVKNLAHFNEKNGKRSYWLNPREYEQKEFASAWNRISLGSNNN